MATSYSGYLVGITLDFESLSKAANIGFGLFAALVFSKKWFVPGWLWEAEKTRADKYEQLYYDLVNEVRQSATRVQAVAASV
jgi:hypothetical protein